MFQRLTFNLSSKQKPVSYPLLTTEEEKEEEPGEIMIALIRANIPLSVGQYIIMGYLTIPSLRKICPFNPNDYSQFFMSRRQYTFFHENFSDLAEADKYCIWGAPKALELVLKRNTNTSLLTTSIDGDDHRGPGFIPSGTLFERAMYVGEFYIKDETGQTMAGLIKKYLIERCGIEEFKKQATQAKLILEEECKRKTDIEIKDVHALNNVWNILKKTHGKNLIDNPQLKTAMDKYKKQLSEPGNETIIQVAEKLYDEDFVAFSNEQNYFAVDHIIGLAQKMRYSVCELQILHTGLCDILEDKEITKRIDVRRALGILGTAENKDCILGVSCHLNVNGGPGLVKSSLGIVFGTCEFDILHNELAKRKKELLEKILLVDDPSNQERLTAPKDYLHP